MRTRTTHINLRVTPQEKVKLERDAERCNLSLSEYLRRRGNDYEPQPAPTNEYFELTRLLTGIYNDFRTSGDAMYAELLADTLLELQKTINPVKCNGNDKNMAGS